MSAVSWVFFNEISLIH